MNIDPKTEIHGVRLTTIRDFLIRFAYGLWTVADLATHLSISQTKANNITKSLRQNGYIEKDKKRKGYDVTNKGCRLRLASARKPITRATAERLVTELLERAKQINASPELAHIVKKIVVYGSYLTNKTPLGDIDLQITFEHRHQDHTKQLEVEKLAYQRANATGRRLAKANWPLKEVELILHARSPTLNFMYEAYKPSKVIFEARSLAGMWVML